MDTVVKSFEQSEVENFYSLFQKLIRNEFPEYSHKTREYLLSGRRAWKREYWGRFHEDPYKTIYGAWGNEKLIGILMGRIDVGGVSFASWLMVDPAYQKKNIGTQLLSRWEHDMRERGIHALNLWCKDDNILFYEKNGYKKMGRVPHFYFGTDQNLMVKHLQQPKEAVWLSDEV